MKVKMEDEWWDRPICILCDFWWLLLLILVFGLVVFFTRDLWIPKELFPPTPTSTPIDTVTPTTKPTPAIFDVPPGTKKIKLCPGDVAHMAWLVSIAPAANETDILFSFDQTGSMSDLISETKTTALSLMESIFAELGNARFGVAGFADYPGLGGKSGDFPYELYQPITDDKAAVQEAIDSLRIFHGGDTPESYLRMLFESYSDSNIDWRSDSRKLLIIFGDQIPQEPDAGRDGELGTGDDISSSDVLSVMKDNGIYLIVIGNLASGDRDFWEKFSTETGGLTANLNEPGELKAVVEEAVKKVSRHINEMKGRSSDEKYSTWVNSKTVRDITVVGEVKDVTVPLTFSLPGDSGEPGDYHFELEAVGDGATYARQDFTITIPVDCGY